MVQPIRTMSSEADGSAATTTLARTDAVTGEILEAERSLYQAMIRKDFATLEQILSPDLVYIHSTAVAETRTKVYLRSGSVTGNRSFNRDFA